jgi:pSer/pThr/pTyr-binding forkhead associated (FHA) protein
MSDPRLHSLHLEGQPRRDSFRAAPDNDVVIRDECVSRRHCAVVIHHDMRVELHDVASKNGTILNGKKIPGPTKIQSGDQITLCGRRLTFHITEGPSEPGAVIEPA